MKNKKTAPKTTEEARELFLLHGLVLDDDEIYINNRKRMLAYTQEGYKVIACYKYVKKVIPPHLLGMVINIQYGI